MLSGQGMVREENHYTFPANVFSISEDKEGRIWVTLADNIRHAGGRREVHLPVCTGSISFCSRQTLRPSGTMIL